ncbi:hypothetical protein SAMN07250955_104190 [Arboricoccus pini]|uniref:Uncharacterized protein n=1 Tax=Arboricoccus pini TaxID=1963835 RepID=A0A212QZP4_9PROT|nr:hypothetical protein [Arboricoccus pini]SNB65070.1 hypothetical protein SAMN07250955_104190 [Arboricoccus pini]
MAESEFVSVEILLSREEKVSLEESARREGVPIADYLRRAILYVIRLEDQLEKLDQTDASAIVRAATDGGQREGGEREARPSLDSLLARLRRTEERYLALERRTARLETLIELTAVGASSAMGQRS